MRAIWFILKLPLKILMADSVADPVRLDLCGDCLCLRFGAGAYQHGGCPAGCGSSDYLLLAKRHYPAGDSISH